MVSVEPYNAIAEAEGLANTLVNFSEVDPLPVFMAATPEFVQKSPDTIVAYLKAWREAAEDFKNHHDKVADTIYTFYTSKGYKMSRDTFKKALAGVEVNPGFPDLKDYMQHHAEALIKAKKIKAVPDWSKVLRPEFMHKAMA
jgi:ABC-type nitrate/sulfonate/bicarbonate transport system substrate-binding protein